jgi:hypothetical protein
MLKQTDVKITNLLLDPENPRLTEGERGQADTIHAMLRAEGAKTLALTQSIAKEGLSPMERLLVMPAPNDSKRFLVLEGNRRITALKMLGEPALAEAALTPAQMKSLRKWSADYRVRGVIETASCVEFDTREEANVWIERRHRGDQGGVGVVRWGATESARFDARRSGKRAPELQLLDFVSEHGNLDAATRDKLHNVSITNLKRLIRDKHVRDALGLTLEADGRVSTHYPNNEVLKGLTRIVRDLARENIKVADIYTAKERKSYIARFRASERPSPAKALPNAHPLIGDGTGTGTSGGSRGGVTKGMTSQRPRPTLIPSTCTCDIKVAKLRNIYSELRRLKLEEYPNAISVLLRVFLELSVDDLIENATLMTEQQAAGSKLRDKLTKVADHLASKQRLTEKQAKAAKKVANDQHIIGGNVTTFHQYVHNKEFAASPTDLRTAWDNLQPFFEATWPGKSA